MFLFKKRLEIIYIVCILYFFCKKTNFYGIDHFFI